MKVVRFFVVYLAFCFACIPGFGHKPNRESKEHDIKIVEAKIKTDEVETIGDAADDSCTYINKDHPSQSLIIGTDKKSGLAVYNLNGKRLQKLTDGNLNNVDIRYEFEFDNDDIALISSGNRSTNTLDFYYVDDDDAKVKRLAVGVHKAEIEIYGSCMYRSPKTEKMYVFANSKDGVVIQWEVKAKKRHLTLTKVRTFDVGTQVEGCVVDDELGRFYIGEEAVGIWQYGAEPKDGDARKQIDHTGAGGNLVADVEGLTIYRIKDNDGYLLVSSQGENAYNIYHRNDGTFVGKFQIMFEGKLVEDTDGIDVVSHRLNKEFPSGLLVAQDGSEANERQSFKYVSWDDLANQFSPPLKRAKKDPIIDN